VDARVDGTLAEIEADDPVIAGDGFGGETFEHARGDPFVAAIPQRRIRHSVAQEALDIDPGAAGHEPDQDAFEADPVRDPRSMTPQRMLIDSWARQQRLHRRPHRIYHFRFERAHDVRDLHRVVGTGSHPASKPGRHNDRWMSCSAPIRATS